MCPTEQTREHSTQAEKLRRLRLQLADTSDEPQRHIILRQIEELEDESEKPIEAVTPVTWPDNSCGATTMHRLTRRHPCEQTTARAVSGFFIERSGLFAGS